MSSHAAKFQPHIDDDSESDANGSDAVWGAAEIGKEINRTPEQVRYLFGQVCWTGR